MRLCSCLAALLSFLGMGHSDETRSLRVGAKNRTYQLHVPMHFDSSQPAPLLIVFHGAFGSPANIARITGFNADADKGGVIVAYPGAYGDHWDDGRPETRATDPAIDDLLFVRRLVRELRSEFRIDKHRVYAVGLSNGGMMCHRLGCEMAAIFSGIATVAGSMPTELARTCTPKKGLSVLIVHGTEDTLVPWQGGELRRGAGGHVLGAEATASFWATAMKCTETSREDLVSKVTDGTKVWKKTYGACRRPNAQVVFYGIEGGGHGWAGKRFQPRNPVIRALLGTWSLNLDVTKVIWEFFGLGLHESVLSIQNLDSAEQR